MKTRLQSIHALDVVAMQWIAQRRQPALTRAMRWVTHTGEGRSWFIAALAFNVLRILGHPIETLFLRAFFCPLATYLVGTLVKRAVKRVRPERTEDDERLLVRTPRDTSFPSLHAAGTASFAFALVLVGHPWAIPVAVWAVVVSFTRYYLGVHYPSDIAAGIALGLGTGPVIFLLR
ncbi:MAG TPA: phosphatase PAP2 family protein [Labilithrix sp.]|nr:phosphatase PAP2 family protein [Labilithrix sp.]